MDCGSFVDTDGGFSRGIADSRADQYDFTPYCSPLPALNQIGERAIRVRGFAAGRSAQSAGNSQTIRRGILDDLQISIVYVSDPYRHSRRLRDNKSPQFLKLRSKIVVRRIVDQDKESQDRDRHREGSSL
jgi:hypothetical protein